ncbi:MAG: hypothetical protein HOM21_02200, partial [Halobacteriovoraceae bacterium]|nr:hypothetical protein [Halobacteriovoraceae bacterium]
MLKKLAIITSILVLLFGGAIFYASTLVSDSQLKEIILSGASEAFPKAQIEIPKLEISWGPTLKIVLEGVSLAAKDAPRKKLIKLAKLDLLLPLYSIVTGGGKLELTIDGLAVEDLDERQWDILGGKKTESKTSAASDKPLDVEKQIDQLPAGGFYVKRSSLSIALTNLSYTRKRAQQSGTIKFAKIQFSDIELDGPAKMEVLGKLDWKQGAEFYQLDLNLKGHASLPLPPNAAIPTAKLELKIENIKTALYGELPPLLLNISSKKNSNGLLELTSKINIDQMVKFSTLVVQNKKAVEVSKIKGEINLGQVLNKFAPELTQIKSKEAKLFIAGNITLKDDQSIIPNLKISSDEQLELRLSEKLVLKSLPIIKLSPGKILVDIKNQGFGGELNLIVQGDVDRYDTKFTAASIKDLNIALIGRKIVFSRSLLPKTSSSAKKKSAPKKQVKGKQKVEADPLAGLPKNFQLNLELTDLNIEGQPLSVFGKIRKMDKLFAAEKITLKVPGGKGLIDFNSDYFGAGKTVANIDIDIKKFKIQSMAPFLPSQYQKLKGNFATKLKGEIKSGKDFSKARYKLDFNIKNNKRFKKKKGKLDMINEGINSLQYARGSLKSLPRGGVQVRKLGLLVKLQNFLHSFSAESKEIVITDGNSDLKLNGALTYYGPKKVKTDVAFLLTRPISYQLPQSIVAKSSLKGSFKKGRLSISNQNWLLGGSLNTSLSLPLNLNQKDWSLAKLPPIRLALSSKNIKISKENIPAATQLFTPKWIVKYLVENSVGRLWLESNPN